MVRLSTSILALLIGNVSSLQASPKAQAKAKFITVMNQVSKEHGLKLDSKLSREQLTRNILSKSKPESRLRKKRVLEEQAAGDDAVAATDDAAAATDDAAAAADDAVAAADDTVAAADDAVAAADDAVAATDDAVAATDDATAYLDDNYDNAFGADDSVDYSNIFFDLSQFSIKFHSCASLTGVDLEAFGEEEEEQQQQQYYYNEDGEKEDNRDYTSTQVVNYRLCPTDTCQDNSWKGCRNTYGNYMVSLEDYFEAQEEYIEEVFEQYCDYCAQCEYMYTYFNAQCEFYDSCTEYGTVCYEQEKCENDDDGENNCGDDDANQEDEEEITYADFMECTEVEVLEDSDYYTLCSYCKQCDYMFSYFKAECSDYSKCYGYKNICIEDENRRLEENENQNQYYNGEVNDRVFLKIFCDGSLEVGMFSDDQCSNYISDKVDLYETTGLSFTADDIGSEYMTSECISCARKVRSNRCFN